MTTTVTALMAAMSQVCLHSKKHCENMVEVLLIFYLITVVILWHVATFTSYNLVQLELTLYFRNIGMPEWYF